MVNKHPKLQKGDRITFSYISDISGALLNVDGVVIGDWQDVRKFWPEEMGGVDEKSGCVLVSRKDNFGNTFNHAVFPEEVLGVRDNIGKEESDGEEK